MTKIRLLGVEDTDPPKRQPRGTKGLAKALRATMSDGKWHSLRQITSTLTYYIKPDYALRIYDIRTAHMKPSRKKPSESHRVELGRRMLVETEIHKNLSHEVHHEDGMAFYRVILSRAVCKDCHQPFDHTRKLVPNYCEGCMHERRVRSMLEVRKKLPVG